MDDKLLVIIIGVMIGAVVLYAFWDYNRKENEINVGTWFILAYGDILDLSSYFHMTDEKWWLNIVPGSFAVGSISTFFYALGKHRFGKVRWIERICVVADFGITAWWGYLTVAGITVTTISFNTWFGPWFREFTPATITNLTYQLTAIIAFIPMWVSQVIGREIEHPTPWLIWAGAFLAFGILMSYEYDKPEELAYPLVNLFTHYMIGVTALAMIVRLRFGATPHPT